MNPLRYRVSRVDRPETGRRRQNDKINLIDYMLISVEADETTVGGNVDSRRHGRRFERFEARIEAIGENIPHRDELGVGIGGESLLGGARASASATDQPDLDLVARSGVCVAADLEARRGDGRRGRGVHQKRASIRSGRGGIHGGSPIIGFVERGSEHTPPVGSSAPYSRFAAAIAIEFRIEISYAIVNSKRLGIFELGYLDLST